MAATRTRSTPSVNGSTASAAVDKAKEAGDSVVSVARRAKGPALAAGAGAAGLVGGLALGSRMASKRRGLVAQLAPRPRVLGVPVGRKNGLARAAEALGKVAHELGSATNQVSATGDDVRQIREQLDKSNRQSPVEVLLDGLTHRRGAHKREGCAREAEFRRCSDGDVFDQPAARLSRASPPAQLIAGWARALPTSGRSAVSASSRSAIAVIRAIVASTSASSTSSTGECM